MLKCIFYLVIQWSGRGYRNVFSGTLAEWLAAIGAAAEPIGGKRGSAGILAHFFCWFASLRPSVNAGRHNIDVFIA